MAPLRIVCVYIIGHQCVGNENIKFNLFTYTSSECILGDSMGCSVENHYDRAASVRRRTNASHVTSLVLMTRAEMVEHTAQELPSVGCLYHRNVKLMSDASIRSRSIPLRLDPEQRKSSEVVASNRSGPPTDRTSLAGDTRFTMSSTSTTRQ
jgi:hypothetical protein